MRSNAVDYPDTNAIIYTREDIVVNQRLSRMVREDAPDIRELAILLESAIKIIDRVTPQLAAGKTLPRKAKSSFDALKRNVDKGVEKLDELAPEFLQDDIADWAGAKIVQSGFDIEVHLDSANNPLNDLVEAVARRIHAYTEIEDLSANYTIAFTGGPLSATRRGTKLTVSLDNSTSEDDLIRTIAPFLHNIFDAQDPDYDDDLYGLLLDL